MFVRFVRCISKGSQLITFGQIHFTEYVSSLLFWFQVVSYVVCGSERCLYVCILE
jgi:hypothetical protein